MACRAAKAPTSPVARGQALTSRPIPKPHTTKQRWKRLLCRTRDETAIGPEEFGMPLQCNAGRP